VSLRRNVIANYFGAFWNALMLFAFVPFYIRYLGVAAYGLIGIYTMLQAWLSFLDLGVAPVISRELAAVAAGGGRWRDARGLLRSIEYAFLAISTAVALVIGIGSGWLATHWLVAPTMDAATLTHTIALMGIVVGLRLLENVYRSSLIGLQRQVALNIASAFVATLRGLGSVAVLAWGSPTINAYFGWQCCVSVISVLVLATTTYRAMPDKEGAAQASFMTLRRVWQFAAGTMLVTFLSLLLTQLDKLMLSRLLDLKEFGYYAFAVTVAQLPLALVAPVTQAFYPRFVEMIHRDDRAALSEAYHIACQLIGVLLGSGATLLIVLGLPVLLAWTGDAGLSARTQPLVAVIATGTLLSGLMTPSYYLQLSAGWVGLVMRVNFVAILIVIPVLAWALPRYGAMGAAWVWLALNLANLLVVIPMMHRRLLSGEGRLWFAMDVAAPLAAAAACACLIRQFASMPAGRIGLLASLAVALGAILISATVAAPLVRRRLLAHAKTFRLRLFGA
jgi:O-antigen/teichoic acid export membrane protein